MLLRRLEARLAHVRSMKPPGVADAADIQAEFTRAALDVPRPPRVERFPLPRERVREKLRAGTPLLHGEPVVVDVQHAAELYSRLRRVVAAMHLSTSPVQSALIAPRQVVEAARDWDAPGDPGRLFGEAFVQHREHLREMAVHAAADPDEIVALSILAVGPSLRAYARAIGPLVPTGDAAWTRGYCPICGAWPLLGELVESQQARRLRCGACGWGWAALPNACPYCGNAGATAMRAPRPVDDATPTVHVCERCRGFLKLVTAREPAPAELLGFEDAATADVDAEATQHGYRRPAGAGFTLELSIPESEWAEDLASLD